MSTYSVFGADPPQDAASEPGVRTTPRPPSAGGPRARPREGRCALLVLQCNGPTVFELTDRQGNPIGTIHVARRSGREIVRVAFDLPREIEIWRGETAEKIRAQRAAGNARKGKRC